MKPKYRLGIVKDILQTKDTEVLYLIVTVCSDNGTTEVFIKYPVGTAFPNFRKELDDHKRIYFHIMSDNKSGRFQLDGDNEDARVIRPIEIITQERFFMDIVE